MKDAKYFLYGVLGIFVAIWFYNVLAEERIKVNAFKQALALNKDKGIVNFGATGSGIVWMTKEIARNPKVVVNVDIRADSTPNFVYCDLGQFPYPFADKQFDVAFCSHILEHLDNWRAALDEWRRVADHIIVVLPIPYLHGWFAPAHKQHFGDKEIEEMRKLPNVFVYC